VDVKIVKLMDDRSDLIDYAWMMIDEASGEGRKIMPEPSQSLYHLKL
jgi:hypothetical protein